LRAEKTLAESQLEKTREERAKLQRELNALKQEAESTWAAELVENALLRERINDVAAEVARLTSALEGPDSPIETILTRDASLTPGNGAAKRAAGAENGDDAGKGSLADRIRSLQARASRVPSAT